MKTRNVGGVFLFGGKIKQSKIHFFCLFFIFKFFTFDFLFLT